MGLEDDVLVGGVDAGKSGGGLVFARPRGYGLLGCCEGVGVEREEA